MKPLIKLYIALNKANTTMAARRVDVYQQRLEALELVLDAMSESALKDLHTAATMLYTAEDLNVDLG